MIIYPNERRLAIARFEAAQKKARVPGSPILQRFVEERRAARRTPGARNETDSSALRKGDGIWESFTGGLSAAGVAITEQSAMRVSAVYASVNLIAGAVASLPLPIYERGADGRKRVEHDLWWLLNREPSAALSAAVMWEYLIGSLLLNGDAYLRILRHKIKIRDHEVSGFELYHKSRVTTKREYGKLWYVVWNESEGRQELIDQADMIHVPGPGFDGLNGQSQIKHALRNSVGIALAADEYSAEFFGNGARPDFAIEMPGSPSIEQQDMMRNTWNDKYQGIGKRHRPALLAGGVKVHELSMNAEDAQLISTRQFQVEDIARIFGVPPHLIGHTDKNSSWGTGIEQMGIGFVKYTLQRHLVKIEQELNRKLFVNDKRFYFEFNTAGLERGDYKTRNEGYRIALGRAGEPSWMTVNEVRKLENLSPIDGGNVLPSRGSNEPTT